MRNRQYNVQLGKGCGLIEETISLLSICNAETTKSSLAAYVHENNFLSKCTDKRSSDIVKLVFYPRFMKRNPSVAMWLKTIRNKGLQLEQFKQLLMIYCARENAVMYDYIIERLNSHRLNKISFIPQGDISDFVIGIVNEGKARWGESIKNKQGGYIKSILVDFGMISRKGEICAYDIYDFTVLYLMHELHFEGLSDVAVWNHEDWQLFGLDKYEVQEKILELSLKGGYIAQSTGELMTISWNYKTMEEFIDGTL